MSCGVQLLWGLFARGFGAESVLFSFSVVRGMIALVAVRLV